MNLIMETHIFEGQFEGHRLRPAPYAESRIPINQLRKYVDGAPSLEEECEAFRSK